MKNVLLVGKFLAVMKDVYRHLNRGNKYKVQICPVQKDILEEVIDITDPDLVVISLAGLDGSHNEFLAHFKEAFPNLKVICYGTVPEQMLFFGHLQDVYFHALTRVASHRELLVKVAEILGEDDGGDTASEELFQFRDKKAGLESVLQHAKKEPGDSGKRKKLLLVDDKAIQLRTLRSLLVNEYDVLLATNGTDALKIMQKNQPDMVFLDYEMPEMNGKDVLERIRQIEAIRDIPVVFLTGEKDKSRIMEVARLNPAGYLLKPPDIDKIQKVIEEILGE